MSCLIPILCSYCCVLLCSVAFLGSGILKKLLLFVVFTVVFVHLYAWQVGILINVNVNCEIMKCNKHQQQITNLQSVWLKQKFNLVSRCTSQNQTLIKFLKFFCLWQCQLFFLFIMYNGFIFDEKGVFYILTAFSSFRKMFRLILSAKILKT